MRTKNTELHFNFFMNRQSLEKISARLLSSVFDLLPDHIPVVYKLSLLITAVIIFCTTALGGLIVYNQTKIIQSQINDLGTSVTSHLARAIREPLLADDKLAMGVLTSSLVNGENVIGTEILSPEGESLVRAGITPFDPASSMAQFSPAEIIAMTAQDKYWQWQLNMNENQIRMVTFIQPIFFKNINAGYTLVTFSQWALDKSIQQAIISIAIASGFIILFGITMAFVLGKRLSAPVNRFMVAIKEIENGNYEFRFDDRRKDELGQLMVAFNHMAEGMLQKSQVEKALDRYLSPNIARQVRANLDTVKLGGQRITATVLFADIVGFTNMSENLVPEELATLLNHYFTLISRASELNFGTIDKYMGDCAMVIFGAPEKDDEHSFHAVKCGLLIRKIVAHENNKRLKEGLFPILFRIGINTGSMLAGNMGSNQRMEYTVVGDSVNLASRLCSIATGGQIIVSQDFYNQIIIRHRVKGHQHVSIRLRGVEEPVNTVILQTLTAEYELELERQFKAIIGPL